VLTDQSITLWVLQRAGREIACWARLLQGRAEMTFRMDGREYLARIFPNRVELQAEADAKRAELEAEGWTARDTD